MNATYIRGKYMTSPGNRDKNRALPDGQWSLSWGLDDLKLREQREPHAPTSRRDPSKDAFQTDPTSGEGAMNLFLEQKLEEAKDCKVYRTDPKRRKTLYDSDTIKSALKNVSTLMYQGMSADKDAPKIGAPEVEALKAGASKQEKFGVSLRRMVQKLWMSLSATFGGVFSRGEKHGRQCELFGHVPPPTGATGDVPCVQCGKILAFGDMLRGASRDQLDIQPPRSYDNRLK